MHKSAISNIHITECQNFHVFHARYGHKLLISEAKHYQTQPRYRPWWQFFKKAQISRALIIDLKEKHRAARDNNIALRQRVQVLRVCVSAIFLGQRQKLTNRLVFGEWQNHAIRHMW